MEDLIAGFVGFVSASRGRHCRIEYEKALEIIALVSALGSFSFFHKYNFTFVRNPLTIINRSLITNTVLTEY